MENLADILHNLYQGYVNHGYQGPAALNTHGHGFTELFPREFAEQISQVPRIYLVVLSGIIVERIG